MMDTTGLRKFQFHKGTIKPIAGSTNASNAVYFNSIKVRLNPSSPTIAENV